jgi:CRP-like cAMP-binding protein
MPALAENATVHDRTTDLLFVARPARAESRENRLLALLPPPAYERVMAIAETVELRRRAVVVEPLEPIKYAYFPLSGCLSVVTVMRNGNRVEVGTVGPDGMCGVSLLHGVDRVPTECIVQVPGTARRIATSALQAALGVHPGLRRVLLRYADAWVNQVSQGIACNALHPVENRLARWLLASHDSVAGDVLPLTQEFIAIMLGVRRATVTIAATALQNARLIDYLHGKITVINRAGLEQVSCECYRRNRAYYEILLGVGDAVDSVT